MAQSTSERSSPTPVNFVWLTILLQIAIYGLRAQTAGQARVGKAHYNKCA
jgi:hypothetical protein